MTEVKYLPNGQECLLLERLQGPKYLVKRIFQHENEFGDICDVQEEQVSIVNEVFDAPPAEKISGAISLLRDEETRLKGQVDGLKSEIAGLKSELLQYKQTIINDEKFIINRSDLIRAKSLAMFVKGRTMPIIYDSDKMRGIKLTVYIDVRTGESRSWGYKIYDDRTGGSEFGEFLCEKYGFIIDPTQQQIDDVILKRLNEFDFGDYEISITPDKYLSETLLKRKEIYVLGSKKRRSEEINNQILKLKNELDSIHLPALSAG